VRLKPAFTLHRCVDCAYWEPALTYFGELTGQGGCRFTLARNRKGDRLPECLHFQAKQKADSGKPSGTADNSSYEPLPNSIWASAWDELYKVYSERLNQENIDLMDSIFSAVVADFEMARKTVDDQQATGLRSTGER
jgi:hypothetical protein